MEQEKLNKLIEANWTTLGIKKINPNLYDLWKEFSELVRLDAKAQQTVNSYASHIRTFDSKDNLVNSLEQKGQNIADDYEIIVFDQLSLIILQIGENYLNSSKLKNPYLRMEKFFNFIWYCVYPLLFYKSFTQLIRNKNLLFDGLFDDLSMIFYEKIVDEKTIELNKLHPSTRFLFLIVGNLLDSIKES